MKELEMLKREGTMAGQRDCCDSFQVFEGLTRGIGSRCSESLMGLNQQPRRNLEMRNFRINGEALLTPGFANDEVTCSGMC